LIRAIKTVIRAVIHSETKRAYLFPTSKRQTSSSTTATRKENIMSMLDWNTYRQQIMAGVGEVSKLSPDTVKGYVGLAGASHKTARLGAKVNELIALAVAVTLRCDGCITVHTDAAIKAGATREEIAEALGTAITVNAGAALVYSTRTLDAFAAHEQGGK
jgi:AhpD family alkylhydroperoxidase